MQFYKEKLKELQKQSAILMSESENKNDEI